MAKFETANVLVDLGGDRGNQVPKYNVTAPEIAVLREIHGEEAVHDIEPTGFSEETQHSFERRRLVEFYGLESPVSRLFPGSAPRLFESIAELDLPEEFFKAVTRVAPAPAPAKKSKKSKKSKKAEAEPDPAPVEDEVVEEDDGIRNMKDDIFS